MGAGISRNLLIAVLLAALANTVQGQDTQSAANEVGTPEPATLVLWNRPIVTFRATVGGATPEQRVRNVRARFDALKPRELAQPVKTQAARIGDAEGILLTVGDDAVFGLVPEDQDPESVQPLDQMVVHAAARLQEALTAREQQRRIPLLMRAVALAVLTSLLYVAVIRLTFIVRRRVLEKMGLIRRGRQLVIAGIDIVPTLAAVERATLRVVSWAIVGVCTFLWATFVLQLFPYTEPLGQRLGGYIARQLADAGAVVLRATPRIIIVIGILLITRAVSLLVARLLAEVEHGVRAVGWLAQEQARATRRIAIGIIWMVGIVVAYPILPWSKSAVFQGMSVVLGLALSIASGGLINQWISGLVLLYSRSFKIGDFVMAGDIEGYVSEMGALTTKVRTMRREEITIPNAVLVADRVTNCTRLGAEQGALLSTSVSIGYDVPWQQVRALLLEAAATTPGVRPDPPARVLPWELGSFAICYQLHVYLERPQDRVPVRAELHARILDAFNARGVQIMTPHFESQPDRPVIASVRQEA